MKTYFTIYFGTLITAMFLVPFVSRLAKKFHIVDVPGPRKIHTEPVPRIGGVAFVISTLLLVIPVFFLNNKLGQSFRQSQTQLIALLVSACFVFAVGLLDDLHPIRGYIKLLCLIAASLVICVSNATLHSISLGHLYEIESNWIIWPFTVLWIITITVGMNFIDGLDGLAAGIAAFMSGTIFIIAVWSGQMAMSVLMLAVLGSVTGFLFFNFYPAKIFMGDCGSMFLGFIIGAGSIICQTKSQTLIGLAIPFLVMGLPILDMGYLIVSRSVLERRSIFSPDRNHLHHRLLDLGLNHRAVVLVLYAVTAISSSLGVFILTAESKWSKDLLIVGMILLLSFFALLNKGRYSKTIRSLKRNWALARKAKIIKYNFEDVYLRMRESGSYNKWWETVCLMGKHMDFSSIELWQCKADNPVCISRWQSPCENSAAGNMLKFTLPLKGDSGFELRGSVNADDDGSFELSGRKTMLLSRLMDDFPPPQINGSIETGISDSGMTGGLAVKTTVLSEKIPPQVNIMKIPITPFRSYDQILECIEDIINLDRKSFCVAVNPLKIYQAWQEPELLNIMQQAGISICDGIGVSIACKILNGISIKRCTGCDLFFRLLSMASQKGWTIFLLGASPESNSGACAKISQMFPSIKIAGTQDGFFKDSAAVIEKINASNTDLLFVAMGSPKQEKWIWHHWKSLKVNFCMGVGGSFDVAAGSIKRAPKIFRITGTEFLFRLLAEPRKRWKMQKNLFPYFFRIIGKKIVDIILVSDDTSEKVKK